MSLYIKTTRLHISPYRACGVVGRAPQKERFIQASKNVLNGGEGLFGLDLNSG